jgi:hypothetical protein
MWKDSGQITVLDTLWAGKMRGTGMTVVAQRCQYDYATGGWYVHNRIAIVDDDGQIHGSVDYRTGRDAEAAARGMVQAHAKAMRAMKRSALPIVSVQRRV